jgi:O-antigen/teichoic acid export membrane protein
MHAVSADVGIEERVDTGGRGLRQHAARGTLINSAFQVGMAGLGLLRRLLIAAFLTRAEFGIWGIIITTLITLSWLKELGISDKYVQQSEPDQEAAYQKAFTLELVVSLAFFAILVLALPIYGAAYGHAEIILPGIVLATSVPISAFESALWIPYRRMQFVRQRALASIDPVAAFVLTVVFGALGTGYWCLVIGTVGGSIAGALVATVTSPYKPRLRFHKSTLREYASFSLPVFGYQVTNLMSVQAVLLVAAHTVGIRGLGSMGLAASISAFADRVDTIISNTIYPAVCAVVERTELLFEAYVTSNRLALMWGLPFGVGLAIFASDFVHFGLGDRWVPAIGLLAAFGLIAGFRQIGFNWQIFMRARNNTRPLFVAALTNLALTAVLTIPLMLAFGLTGYAFGMAGSAVLQVIQRGWYMSRLFPGFRPMRHLVRSIAPSVPATGVVLLERLALGGDRSPARAAAEAVLYVLATIAATWFFERDLIKEMVGYLRGGGGGLRSRAEAPVPPPPPEPAGV